MHIHLPVGRVVANGNRGGESAEQAFEASLLSVGVGAGRSDGEAFGDERSGQVGAARTHSSFEEGPLKHVALRMGAAEALEAPADRSQFGDDVVPAFVAEGDDGPARWASVSRTRPQTTEQVDATANDSKYK